MGERKSATKTLVRLRTGRDPEELVRELYLERGRSDREIAEALGIDRGTVNLWRHEWDIHRDGRPPIVLEPDTAA